MQVIALGTGTAVPHPFRGPAGYLVRSRESRLLLDCGSGTLQRLARAETSVESLDAIFLTHPHLDHVGDLPAIMFAQRVPGFHRDRPLELHADSGMADFLGRLAHAYGDWMEPRGGPLVRS